MYTIPQKWSFVQIEIVDHCNLNCKGCNNFSSLAGERFLEPSAFERDMARLSELTKGSLTIHLYGGEPLLHPELLAFIDIARKYFPDTTLKIITNGILLKSQPEKFWQSCENNKVVILISSYPINIDIEAIQQLAQKYCVPLEYTFNKSDGMSKFALDISGKQDYKQNHGLCHYAGRCVSLRDGKIYACNTVSNVKHFNRYFNQNLEITEDDYIDIYKAKNLDEIKNYLRHPIPFCRYCDLKNRDTRIKWAVSRQQIEEWVNV
jgi:MoaA/NifB/PqqE/SkfB family radical SAM enzyme